MVRGDFQTHRAPCSAVLCCCALSFVSLSVCVWLCVWYVWLCCCAQANLTVRETFKFAVDSCVADPSLLEHVDPKLIAWHRRKVDLLLSVLGMHECADTIAGNAVIRGISGGQKKRLTIGEFMITNSRVLLLDEPTTGLDAAVARDIMVVLRKWCGISGSTVIAALLQPTPSATSCTTTSY